MTGADLRLADLKGADLTRVDLSGPDLTDVFTHQDIASIQDTNVYLVRKAPDGFTEWALANGAVQKDPEAWQAFVKNGYKEPDEEDSAPTTKVTPTPPNPKPSNQQSLPPYQGEG